jgi:dTDP-glucose 4,6-dehydratase
VHEFSRVVVTGGAGFIGSHLCDRLVGDGYEVLCLDNLSTGSIGNVQHLLGTPGFEFCEADTTEMPRVDGGVDAVMHLASPASPPDYLRLPLETLRAGSVGTLNALDLARAKGARLVLASTSEVYGGPLVHPQVESYWGHVNPVGPRAVYDESKRFAEAAVAACQRAWGLDVGIVRIFNTYGPRMKLEDGRVVPAFIRSLLLGKPMVVHGSGDQTRAFCYVDDTVDGLLRMMRSDHPGPINLGSPDEMSVLALAREVAAAGGCRCDVVFGPRPVDDPTRRCPDTFLADAVLGWRPRIEIGEGLRRTVQWFCRPHTGSTTATGH